MTGHRCVYVLVSFWLFSLFHFSGCNSSVESRKISTETDSYVYLWIEGMSLNQVKKRDFFLSSKFIEYEQKIGDSQKELEKNRMAIVDPSMAINMQTDRNDNNLADKEYLVVLTTAAIALERLDLETAFDLLNEFNLEENEPKNSLDLFQLYLRAKWNNLLGNHFKSSEYLKYCKQYIEKGSTPNIKTIFATELLKSARQAGIASQATQSTIEMLDNEANQELVSNYYLERALSTLDSGTEDPRVDSLFVKSLYSSFQSGKLQIEGVSHFNEYLSWKESLNNTGQLATEINTLCDTITLRQLYQFNPPRIGELFYRIVKLSDQKKVSIQSDILKFVRTFFEVNIDADSRYFKQYRALNLSNQNAEDELRSVLQGFENFQDFYSDAPLSSEEATSKAFKNIQGRKTRANVQIRGLSDATIQALGLSDLVGQNTSSTLDVQSLKSMSSLIKQVSSASLFDNNSSTLKNNVDEMVEIFLKEAALSWRNNKNDSIVDLCLQTIQAQFDVHVPTPIDDRIRFQNQDEDFPKYLKLKSACLISENAYNNETRAGSSEKLRNARKELIDFIVSKDQLTASKVLDSKQWNLRQSSLKNVMVYYSGENSAVLISKTGNDIDLHEIELTDDFTEEIQFILNKGMDLASITNEPEVTSRLYNIASSWHQKFVLKYWPKSGEEIVILPVGNFAFVNWESLNTNKDGTYNPLIHDYEISYQADVASLFSKEQNSNTPIRMAGFATENYPVIPLEFYSSGSIANSTTLNPLQGALEEVSNVCELFQGKAFTKSTRTDFLESIDDYNVMLVSTHGIVLPSKTKSSTSLVFSPDEEGQYLIHADDFLERKLNAQLVAIPSCNSALGAASPNGGLKGLSGSILNSGASAVVASLIELPDKTTSEIVRSFFKNLNQGMKKSEALRKAKLDYLNQFSGAKAHPVFWSGLLLMGDNSALSTEIEPSNKNESILDFSFWWLMFLLIPILYIIIRRKTKKGYLKK